MPPTHLVQKEKDPAEFVYRSGTVGDVIEIAVHYTTGSSPHTRGVYLSLRVYTITDEAEQWIVGAGHRRLVRQLSRSSRRVLREVAVAADPYVVELAATYSRDAAEGKRAFDQLAERLLAPVSA